MASRSRRLILVVVGVAIVYEWGIGNDLVIPWMSAAMLSAFGDGFGATLLVALVVAVVTALQQMIVGWAALYALTFSPSTVAVASDAVTRRFGVTVPSWWHLPRYQAVAISFTLGGTFVATEEVLAGATRHKRTVLASSFVCGLVVFGLVGLSGSLVLASEGTPFEDATQLGLRILSNPLLWLALAVLPFLARSALSKPAAAPSVEPTICTRNDQQ